jgi:hypothetical protein
MSNEDPRGSPPATHDGETRERWTRDRTTFQRVYDVMTGITAYERASAVATRADCSDDGARNALDQLAEMGIVDRRGSRPAAYRRNESYFRWRRVETLADEHTHAELRERLDRLLDEDAEHRQSFGVPDPDAVPVARMGADDGARNDHAAVHDRLESLSRWRTVRDDIELIQRALSRTGDRRRDEDDVGVSA